MPILIEAAVSSVADAVAAVKAGAGRIELSIAPETGGLTPSLGLMRRVREAVDVPVVALVRPRPAGFAYDDDEVATMAADAAALVSHGADAIAFGVLTSDGWVHNDRTRLVLDAIADASARRSAATVADESVETDADAETRPPAGAVMHRAFDVTVDPLATLDTLIGFGFQRVLTSGQCESVLDGAALLRRLRKHAAGRIEILAGGGVRERNVERVIAQSGCDQIHGTFSSEQRDDAGPVADALYRRLNAQVLTRVRERLAGAEKK